MINERISMPDEIQNGQELVEQKPPEELSTSNETQKSELELPDDASDRTKEQFEKLKQHNKELSDRLKALEPQNETNEYNPFGVQPRKSSEPKVQLPDLTNKPTAGNIYDNLVDQEGYVDPSVLKQAIKQATEAAEKATLEARLAREELDRRTETEQVRSAHKEFPWLDPKGSKFDQKFFNAVKNEMISQLLNGEKDYVAAAKKVASWYPLPKEEDNSVKKQEQVRQANLTGTTQSHPSSTSNDQDLVRRMWKGDRSALLERLTKGGF